MPNSNSVRRIKFGDYVADLDSFELRKHGVRLKVQDQPFQILKLLLQRPGDLVTREELRVNLWTESTFVDFDAGLNAAIRRLRDALNDSAEEPRYIETLPRHGYRFIAPVEPLLAAQNAVVSRPVSGDCAVAVQEAATFDGPAAASDAGRAERINTIWRALIAASAVLLLLSGISFAQWRSKVYAKRLTPQIRAVAVLPFANLSSNASEQYFADAMTDALISNLSQVGCLKVTSRTSVMQYRSSSPSVPEIGRELHVNSIVEGSVVRVGNRVRITAQLIDANSDRHLWAKSYDRDLTDILSVQAEVATEIAFEIRANLTPEERTRLSLTKVVNPDSYEAYLKARYFFQKEDMAGQEKAKEYYSKSIQLDPSFAPAYAGLAENYAYMAFMGFSAPDGWLEAEKLVKKAIELDPTSAPSRTVYGLIRWQYYCDRPGAEKEFALALQSNPGDIFSRDYYSYYLLKTGRKNEAIEQKRRILALDPVSSRTNAELGLYYLEAGRYDDAIEQLKKAVELDPANFRAMMRLGFAYQGKKQYDLAIAQMKKAIALDDVSRRYEQLGYVYALNGQKREALETIAALKRKRSEKEETAVGIARIYAGLGKNELAFSWLEKAKPGDEIPLSDPGFAGLHMDPQFKAFEDGMQAKEKVACPSN
jgi:TolB-like protein/DNA-binding winged helix-turn-helix (wHTH) protein/cytochrome c-type biogenesis protein CcmH/NrfG